VLVSIRRGQDGRQGHLHRFTQQTAHCYRKHSLDVIWCDRGEESSVELIHGLKKKDPSAKVVCDTCAVYSQFILRGLPYATSDEQKQQIPGAVKRWRPSL
jgi:hypothetical protein